MYFFFIYAYLYLCVHTHIFASSHPTIADMFHSSPRSFCLTPPCKRCANCLVCHLLSPFHNLGIYLPLFTSKPYKTSFKVVTITNILVTNTVNNYFAKNSNVWLFFFLFKVLLPKVATTWHFNDPRPWNKVFPCAGRRMFKHVMF